MISPRPLTLLAFVAILFWWPQNTQQQEAGEIREIKCKGYLLRPNAAQRDLHPTRDKKLKLYPLDKVKCEGPGTLELDLRGQHFSVKEEHGWYPILVPNNPPPDESGPSRVGWLRGTFRLEGGLNDLGEHAYNLPSDWTTPLKPPSILAIELSGGNTVTMSSSLFPMFSFVADGREYEVQTSQGETAKVVGVLGEKQLKITSKTEKNTLDAVFTLEPDGKIKFSQSLSATNRPATTKEANYRKVSEVAFLNIFPLESPERSTPAEAVFLRKGEKIVAEVDTDISSVLAKDGDEFSLTVKEPERFRGAKVKGHLSNITRSSSGDVLHLNFDVIVLTNGAGYRFPGKMEVKGGHALQSVGAVTSKEGATFGIVRSNEKAAMVAAEGAASSAAVGVSFVRIEKGTEIIMTPMSASAGPP